MAKHQPMITEIPDNCPKCRSSRVVDATVRVWHLPAVRCQICGWYKEVAAGPAMPMPKDVGNRYTPAEIEKIVTTRKENKAKGVTTNVISLRERKEKLLKKIQAIELQEQGVMA